MKEGGGLLSLSGLLSRIGNARTDINFIRKRCRDRALD